jgi:carboxylesterase type B
MEPLQAAASGKFAKIPVMIGTVSEEALFFIYEASPKPASEAEYLAIIAYIFGYDFASVLEEYPPPGIITDADMRPLVSRMGTDFIFSCSTRAFIRGIAKAGVPTYLYQFSHVLSFDAWGPRYPFCIGHGKPS